MSRDPVRLEPVLTREYVDRSEKMRGLSNRSESLEWIDVLLIGALVLVVAIGIVINF